VVDGGTRILDPGRESSLLRDDELGLAYALGASGDAVKIALVRGRLRHRHLLHWYPAERVAIVSLAGWDEPETARAFVAFQMALQSTRHRRPEWDPGAVQHADARGCWGDACESREETRAMLAAGDLCAECRRVYEAAGVDVTTFLHFVGAVRDLAPRFPD
jgi:hypothetical protein